MPVELETEVFFYYYFYHSFPSNAILFSNRILAYVIYLYVTFHFTKAQNVGLLSLFLRYLAVNHAILNDATVFHDLLISGTR